MKNFSFNKKFFQISIYAIFIICVSIAFEKFLGNATSLVDAISIFFKAAGKVLSPFIIGFSLAYLLSFPLGFFENEVYSRINYFGNKKILKRNVSIITTYVIAFGVIFFIISYMIPEISKNITPLIELISNSLPNYINNIIVNLEDYFEANNVVAIDEIGIEINRFIGTTFSVDNIIKSLNAIPDMFTTIASVTLNSVLGIVISFYILQDKEKLANIAKKIINTFASEKLSRRIISIIKSANNEFRKFFVGASIDSIIIGFIFFIGGIFLKLPFLPVLTLIVGITNMIPFFGPFIGGAPVVLIVFLNNIATGEKPFLALWTALFIFILQQFDGIVLKPKIIGNSTGLSPISIMFSIIVGGELFGVVGMFLGVPVFALLTNLLFSYMNKKQEKKNQKIAN